MICAVVSENKRDNTKATGFGGKVESYSSPSVQACSNYHGSRELIGLSRVHGSAAE
jgi:hypothetical protein